MQCLWSEVRVRAEQAAGGNRRVSLTVFLHLPSVGACWSINFMQQLAKVWFDDWCMKTQSLTFWRRLRLVQPNYFISSFPSFFLFPSCPSDLPSFLSFLLPSPLSLLFIYLFFFGLTEVFYLSQDSLSGCIPCLFLSRQIFQRFLQMCSLVKTDVLPSQHFGSSKGEKKLRRGDTPT